LRLFSEKKQGENEGFHNM
jgi:hypothetical protein